MLRIDAAEVVPAEIDGINISAFQSMEFTLKKSRWVSDESSSSCALCKNKFNQLRRRHHCRCCGEVFCNKCCTEKVPLPQYGLDNPERVCSACLPVATCVTMSYSNDHAFQLRAVTGLSGLCRDAPAAVVSLGGAHMLIYLAKKKSTSHLQTLMYIANGLHSLVRHASLVSWLADIGAVSAISRLLSLPDAASMQEVIPVVSDALSALRIFVKTSEKLKIQAVSVGCLPPLQVLCDYTDPSVSLVATITLCSLAECPSNQAAILGERNALRSMLMKVTQSKDEQVTEHVLRVVVVLSSGDDNAKHTICSEDATSGGVLAQVLQSRPKNLQINANAASAIANLATSERDQVLLQSALRTVLRELKAEHPQYVILQLIRATANFSSHACNAGVLLQHLNDIAALLTDDNSKTNMHAVRGLFNIMRHRSKETIAALNRNDLLEFLKRFTEMDEVMEQVLLSLNRVAPPVTL